MPHKDRAARLAYNNDYHARTRDIPAPRPQPNAHLPPEGELVYADDGAKVQCHACGRWYGSLVTHVRTHGFDAARYKERYGLARSASLLSPATADKQRAAALARDQGALGRAELAKLPPAPRAAGIAARLQSRVRYSRNNGRYPRPNPEEGAG